MASKHGKGLLALIVLLCASTATATVLCGMALKSKPDDFCGDGKEMDTDKVCGSYENSGCTKDACCKAKLVALAKAKAKAVDPTADPLACDVCGFIHAQKGCDGKPAGTAMGIDCSTCVEEEKAACANPSAIMDWQCVCGDGEVWNGFATAEIQRANSWDSHAVPDAWDEPKGFEPSGPYNCNAFANFLAYSPIRGTEKCEVAKQNGYSSEGRTVGFKHWLDPGTPGQTTGFDGARKDGGIKGQGTERGGMKAQCCVAKATASKCSNAGDNDGPYTCLTKGNEYDPATAETICPAGGCPEHACCTSNNGWKGKDAQVEVLENESGVLGIVAVLIVIAIMGMAIYYQFVVVPGKASDGGGTELR